MTDTATAIKAFAAAQAAMGKAVRANVNPAFKSKYADLSTVQDACFPALHANGFAIMQPNGHDEIGEYVETIFLHESGERFVNRVYLKVGKPDMQGYGSAITYARRYGLMGLAGIAPEDDDGNGASRTPVIVDNRLLSADQFTELRNLMERSGSDEGRFLAFFKLEALEEMPVAKFDAAKAMLVKKIGSSVDA